MENIKAGADALLDEIDAVPDPRCKALAKTKLEEAVFWAVKGITG